MAIDGDHSVGDLRPQWIEWLWAPDDACRLAARAADGSTRPVTLSAHGR